MTDQYYKTVLGEDWPGIDEYITFFKDRCDSQLEILFALSLVTEYRQAGFNSNGRMGWSSINPDVIWLHEPFNNSPSNNGSSIAYFKPQINHQGLIWDFGIYTGGDNGAGFNECELTWLIDIDGWSVHRGQREWDDSKGRSAKVRAIRICEELFIDVREMADAVLSSTIWDVDMGCVPNNQPKLQFFNPLEAQNEAIY